MSENFKIVAEGETLDPFYRSDSMTGDSNALSIY